MVTLVDQDPASRISNRPAVRDQSMTSSPKPRIFNSVSDVNAIFLVALNVMVTSQVPSSLLFGLETLMSA